MLIFVLQGLEQIIKFQNVQRGRKLQETLALHEFPYKVFPSNSLCMTLALSFPFFTLTQEIDGALFNCFSCQPVCCFFCLRILLCLQI